MIDFTLILMVLLGALRDESPAFAKARADGPAPAPAQGIPSAAPAQDGERPVISATEIKALRDSNIFAPRTAKRRPSVKGSDYVKHPSAPAQPRPPVVTGIFYDAKAQAFLVVLEDRNEASLKQFKEPKFLKAGDDVNGYRVASVTAEKAAFLKGEISRELKVGESLPGPDGKPVFIAPVTDDPEAASAPEGEEKPEKVEIKPIDPETQTKALENLKKKAGKKNRPSQDE
jgi:hypothetical protein